MFEWLNKYRIGLAEVDAQHEVFFQIGKALHEKIMASEYDDMTDYLDGLFIQLVEYTIYHFRCEEEYMSIIEYPHIDHHKRLHTSFLVKLQKLNDSSEMTKRQAMVYLKFISDWILEHITVVDRRIKEFTLEVESIV